MVVLLDESKEPLHDAAGKEITKGSIVHDSIFGEGKATGTVPLGSGARTA